MKDAINQLVLSKLETPMMAKISAEYILKIIELPFVPEKKSQPKRSFIVILGTLMGGMLATLWVLIRRYVQAV
jgi:LPS O-antigen subunit length determinant protein (WzzB/FepE family)